MLSRGFFPMTQHGRASRTNRKSELVACIFVHKMWRTYTEIARYSRNYIKSLHVIVHKCNREMCYTSEQRGSKGGMEQGGNILLSFIVLLKGGRSHSYYCGG